MSSELQCFQLGFVLRRTVRAVLMQELLDQYGKNLDTTGKDVYVCGMCGYEYVGDLDAESDEFVCPVCGQPKKVFRKKQA